MITETLLLFAIAELVFSISPGPAVALIMSLSLGGGYRSGIAATFGILQVNIIFFILSAFGLGAALIASPTLFLTIKYAGALYLCWTAYQIFHGMIYIEQQGPDTQEFRSVSGSIISSFARGFFIQASSVKNIIIFVSIIPQFIDPEKDPASQFFTLCLVSVAVEFVVLTGYVILTASLIKAVKSEKVINYLNSLSAVMLISIAASVAYTS